MKEGIIGHFKNVHDLIVEIANCRSSHIRYDKNEYDFLIYAKDALSFSHMLDRNKWPSMVNNEHITLASIPTIPPQLSLIIRNVDLNIDLDEFSKHLKSAYPNILNIIRLKNKFQNNIKLVKIECTSPTTREELLNRKRITINYLTYDTAEYLAPAQVLICSKCLAIGHFKKQCTQTLEACRICAEQCQDLKQHKCTLIEKCIHCQQNHKSSAPKCPVVRSFRAELTRKLLKDTTSKPNTIWGQQGTGLPVQYDLINFPPLPSQRTSTHEFNAVIQ